MNDSQRDMPKRVWVQPPAHDQHLGYSRSRVSLTPQGEAEYIRADRVQDMIEAGVELSVLLVLAHYNHLDAKRVATCIDNPCAIQRALIAWAEASEDSA
jgi:hypothetical protein